MNPRLERTQKAAAFKAVGDKCKRCKLCPWCGSVNGTVKYARNFVCLQDLDLPKLLSLHSTSDLSHTRTVSMAGTAGHVQRLCKLLPYRKATGSLKYFHDKYNSKTQFAEHQKYVDTFEEAMQYNEQIKPHVTKVRLKPPGIAFQPCQACPCLPRRKTNGRIGRMLSMPAQSPPELHPYT